MRLFFASLLLTLISAGPVHTLQRAIFFGQSGQTPAGGGSGTVTYDSTTGCAATGSGTTITCTATGITAGETIYVDGLWAPNTITGVLTDNGTPVTNVVSGPTVFWSGINLTDTVWVVKNATAGTHVLLITLSTSGGQYMGISAPVLLGASTTSPTDGTATPATAATGSLISNPITTTANGEFLLAFCSNGGTISAGTTPQAMTLVQMAQAVAPGQAAEYGTAVTAGSNSAQCNSTATNTPFVVDLIAVH
jgi:hypothetical protein